VDTVSLANQDEPLVPAKVFFIKRRVLLISTAVFQPVRLAGGSWLVLVCSERKVLLAGCWWLVCSERKVLLAGG
jgi:hypothetical protein